MLRDDAAGIDFKFEKDFPQNETVIKKRPEVCANYQQGTCRNGELCAERHVHTFHRMLQYEVCRHWLRGACVNGPDCVYLHEYEERLIPECIFFSRFGECANPECTYRHVHPDEKLPKCAAYERGFCPLGPECKLRHVTRKACPNYLAGFCPNGPKCKLAHPVHDLFDRNSQFERLQTQMHQEHRDDPNFNPNVTCFKCLDPGHIPKSCPGVPYGRMYRLMQSIQEPGEDPPFTADGEVRGCFICGNENHKMRDCPDRNNRNRRRGRDAPYPDTGAGGGGGYQQRLPESGMGGGGHFY